MNKSLLAAAHETVKSLHDIGLVDKVTMRHFKRLSCEKIEKCIPNAKTQKTLKNARRGIGLKPTSLTQLTKDWDKACGK